LGFETFSVHSILIFHKYVFASRGNHIWKVHLKDGLIFDRLQLQKQTLRIRKKGTAATSYASEISGCSSASTYSQNNNNRPQGWVSRLHYYNISSKCQIQIPQRKIDTANNPLIWYAWKWNFLVSIDAQTTLPDNFMITSTQ
jgi:hypothetical protein